jgi:hypothetical protein
MSSKFCDVSLQFSATCPQNLATFCNMSLSYWNFYNMLQNGKDTSQNLATCHNAYDVLQHSATCLKFV